MIDHDEQPFQTIIRRRLAALELECAQGLARIGRQRERLGQGVDPAFGRHNLDGLLATQAEMERRRDHLRRRFVVERRPARSG